MAFWEDFSETISTKSKEMADKAKNFTDIASLRGQIVSYENVMLRNYKEIGKAYYQAHKNDLTQEFEEQMQAISDAENTIAELKKRISELKGTQKCSYCGNDVPDDSTFCPKCGNKIADEDTFYDEEDSTTDVVVTDVIDEVIDEE